MVRVNSMARENLADSSLLRSLGDLVGSLSDLVQKEVRLAKAEVTEKIASKVQSSIWMMIAGFFGFLVTILLVEAAVFALASFGLRIYWACLLVAAALAAAGAASFYHGRSLAEEDLAPRRALNQIAQDIKTAKEQLT
jgi:uncharacterized membrane protein YqjE